ncbi:hypothetical protein DVS77_23420 [Mycolicibacterium moriokaense]|nr:hypothetical protein DVS77_23420 [Mycolicibacterium moriokaense]
MGTGIALFTMIGAPVAGAQSCEPGHVDNAGQCTVSDDDAAAPADNTGPPGKVVCTQHSCVYREAH